jgi:hypothetical protein
MSSSSNRHNSLVGALWETFFGLLPIIKEQIKNGETISLSEFYNRVIILYRKENSYELLNMIKSKAYPHYTKGTKNTFHVDVEACIRESDGLPDYVALQSLQDDYRSGKKYGKSVRIYAPGTDDEVSLSDTVKECLSYIAAPEEVHGTPMTKFSMANFFPSDIEEAE